MARSLLDVSPEPGMVYRDERGRLLTYVRTEQRPGVETPEHMFVHTRERMVYTIWLPEAPPAAELVVDTEGRKQANEERVLRAVAESDNELLAQLLKKACQWLPRERYAELRREYTEKRSFIPS